MSDIVKSLRRHQKMIILVAALGVVSLYLLPLDQIFAQTSTEARINARFQQAHDQTDTAFNNAIARVANSRLPAVNPDQYATIVSNLQDQQAFVHQILNEHNYRIVSQLPPGAP